MREEPGSVPDEIIESVAKTKAKQEKHKLELRRKRRWIGPREADFTVAGLRKKLAKLPDKDIAFLACAHCLMPIIGTEAMIQHLTSEHAGNSSGRALTLPESSDGQAAVRESVV